MQVLPEVRTRDRECTYGFLLYLSHPSHAMDAALGFSESWMHG
jgi:hypothetical protein